MSLLKVIKSKIYTVESYLRSNSAMKSVAAVRLTKYKKKKSLLSLVKEIASNYVYRKKKQDPEDFKTVHLVVGCNQGMCGSFFSNIAIYIKNLLKTKKEGEKFFILGEKFIEYNIHPDIYVKKLLFSEADVLKISDEFVRFMIDQKITRVYLHHYNNHGIESKLIVEDRDPDNKYCVYRMLNFTQMIMEAIFTSGFYENKERVIALEQAKTNAEKMLKKSYNELNRIRQESITNDLAEIVSGVLL